MNKNSLPLVVLLLVLAGCAGPLYVHVPYVLTTDQVQIERLQVAQSIYVLIHRPAVPSATLYPEAFASILNTQLQSLFAGIGCYRVGAEPQDHDPFIPLIKPSSVLEVTLRAADFSTTIETKQVAHKSGNTVTYTTEPGKWTRKGTTATKYKLTAYPDGKTWAEGEIPVSCSEDYYQEPGASIDLEILSCLTNKTATALGSLVPIAPTIRTREIWQTPSKEKDDSKKALKAAGRGNWKKAEEIWKARLSSGTGTWHDWMNLAITAESQRNFALATELYQQAQKAGASDELSQKINWQEIYQDLQAATTLKRELSPTVEKWFQQKVVVVPFTSETVSIDGPESIRSGIAARLKAGGYNVTSIAEGDKIFQEHGLSDGGQLPAFKTSDLEKWTQADWLIFGDIDEFKELNVAIYVNRSIHGSLKIWDKNQQKEIFSSAIPVETQSLPTQGKQILTHFLLNLGKTWLEHSGNRPLEAEVAHFVSVNLEGIPQKPQ